VDCNYWIMEKAFLNIKINKAIKALSGVIGFANLAKEQRSITFYSEGESYWPHLKGILTATLEKTNKSICYISSSHEDPGLNFEHPKLNTFFVGEGFIRDYFFQTVDTDMMIMTMPDLNNFQVKRSHHKVHYIYVQHSLVSLQMVYRHGAFDHFDTICAAGPHHVNEIREIEAKYDLPRKNIFELGYSRLDSLIETAKKHTKPACPKTNPRRKILVSPSWGPNGVIESGLAQSLVEELLDLGHEVVLRPHFQTMRFSSIRVNEIRNQNKHNSRFIFDGSVAGEESLHQSDIMVSDWSGVALEYAFALNKPVIFCDVPKKINNPNYQDIKIEPIEVFIRKKVGIIWDGISPISDALICCKHISKNDLLLLRERYCFNQGVSDRIFADNIDLFLNRQPN
jgi:hypothetical protein